MKARVAVGAVGRGHSASRVSPSERSSGRRALLAALLVAVGVSTACASAPPLRVEHVPEKATRRSVSASAVATGEISDPTRIVLRRRELDRLFSKDRTAAIDELHALVANRSGGSDEYAALAELSYYEAGQLEKHAFRRAWNRDVRRRRGQVRKLPPYDDGDWAIVAQARSRYLAAAIYAYTFLFTRDEIPHVTPIDPRVRTSVDIYNRALGLAFQNRRGYDEFSSSEVKVPFGVVDVRFQSDDRIWGNRYMTDFIPSDEFVVEGLRNRYRRAGVGAPLAARTLPIDVNDPAAFLVDKNAVVSATAVLLIDDPRAQLEGERISAWLRVAPWSEYETIRIDGVEVPLEAQPSAALAASLQDSEVWKSRFGVFLGRITDLSNENRLFGWEPRLPGQIPIVFVHGTMSSPVVWADMVNDLQADPFIRERYQFLFYSYQSGNPIMYSSMLFRRSLTRAVTALDPYGQDECLRRMVVVGHSQGGLLAKTTAIYTGTLIWNQIMDEPIEKSGFNRSSRRLLEEALFLEPLPYVERVVFISTPHRGSYLAASSVLRGLAARAIQFPADLGDLASDMAGIETLQENGRQLRIRNSIDNMSPRNNLIRVLSKIPVDPSVKANSIISVKGDGPVEKGDDGVVKYTSAHIDEAESELVVDSGHSSQAHPKTIEEMRRILLEHADGLDECRVGASGM